ncbi:hypothetical protein ADUPG1_013156, partial [Aduncisulcus paluster]
MSFFRKIFRPCGCSKPVEADIVNDSIPQDGEHPRISFQPLETPEKIDKHESHDYKKEELPTSSPPKDIKLDKDQSPNLPKYIPDSASEPVYTPTIIPHTPDAKQETRQIMDEGGAELDIEIESTFPTISSSKPGSEGIPPESKIDQHESVSDSPHFMDSPKADITPSKPLENPLDQPIAVQTTIIKTLGSEISDNNDSTDSVDDSSTSSSSSLPPIPGKNKTQINHETDKITSPELDNPNKSV